MDDVFRVDDMPWKDLRDLPGARGYQFKALTERTYTEAYSCELVRLEPGDFSVPHIEKWNHLLYILSGLGEIDIEGRVSVLKGGTVCQVRAGDRHSMRNLGTGEMLLLAIYDPPRERKVA
jgi:quercetin dioxygenase-like cupin family protein